MKITVLFPVYNEKREFLEKAINSIIAQTYADWELLLIDDGSTLSETHETLSSFEQKDGRIVVVRRHHEGLVKTLNYGVSVAKTDLVFRHDQDDWSVPDRFKKQVEFMKNNPSVVLLGSRAQYCHEDGRKLWETRFPTEHKQILEYFPKNPFCHGAVCYRKSIVSDLGGYREEAEHVEDLDLFWRMSKAYKTSNLKEVLYFRRFKRSSDSAVFADKAFVNDEKVRASMGVSGSSENVDRVSCELRIYDKWLLAGYYKDAFCKYFDVLKSNLKSKIVWLKMIRLILFICFPFLRRRLFGE